MQSIMWCCISTWLTGHKSPYVLILPRLWNVEDPNDVGGDDQALGGRLQRLMTDIEEAIKTYGRVCDLYVKKKHFAFVNVFVSLSSSPHRVIREIRRIHFANCDICHLEKKISPTIDTCEVLVHFRVSGYLCMPLFAEPGAMDRTSATNPSITLHLYRVHRPHSRRQFGFLHQLQERRDTSSSYTLRRTVSFEAIALSKIASAVCRCRRRGQCLIS